MPMPITPDTNIIRSVRDGGLADYTSLLCEAIDNALDAAATEIIISIEPHQITFADNGSGITPDRIPLLFTLGGHGEMTSTRLGRFGMGITSQAIRHGDVLEVETCSTQGFFIARVNWREILHTGWLAGDPIPRPYIAGRPTGTEIRITQLRELAELDEEKVRFEIAQRFHPALAEHKRIVLNGRSIELIPDPRLTDVIETTITLERGRMVHLRAGMLEEQSKLNQVNIAYNHRVILSRCSLGCGSYAGLTRMFARVQLAGPWHLGQFKDELPDYAERRELSAALYPHLLPLLERCKDVNFSAKLERIEAGVNSLVPSEISARPRRVKPSSPSPAMSKRAKHHGVVDTDKSDEAPTGPAKRKQERAKLLISLEDCASADGIGTDDLSDKDQHRVRLARDDPAMEKVINGKDEEAAKWALGIIAFLLYVHGLRNAGQLQMFHIDGDIGVAVAALLSHQDPGGFVLRTIKRKTRA